MPGSSACRHACSRPPTKPPPAAPPSRWPCSIAFTHQLVSNGNTQIIGIASVAKLFIADDLLLHESAGKTALSPDDRQAMDIMLQSSDDGAAEKFWGQDGGNVIVTQVASRYGLTSTTPPSDGRWWNTISYGDRPGPLLRHAARRGRWAAGGAGQDHRQRSGSVHPQRNRRLPAAVRHPRRPVRRTGRGQAGLDVLHRRRLDASVDRRDRRGPPLHHGDRVAAALR